MSRRKYRRRQLEPIEQSLLALTGVRNSVERVVLSFYVWDAADRRLAARPSRLSDTYLSFSLQNYLLILLSSFLEEWNRFSSFAKNDAAVLETLRKVKPALDRFKVWKDLPAMRSKLLAHPFRDRGGDIVFASDVLQDGRAPTALGETLLLGLCVMMVVDLVGARHASDRANAESQVPRDRNVPTRGISTTTELESEYARIQAALWPDRHR